MKNLKEKFLEPINLKSGIVTYNDFDIDPDLPFKKQELSFKEDLFQMEFGEKYCIDIGWYREFNPKGSFWIQVIQDIDWMNPLYSKKCRDIKTLQQYLQEAIDFVESLEKIK